MAIDCLNPMPGKRISRELRISNVLILGAAPLLVAVPFCLSALPQPAGYVLAAVLLYVPPLISWHLQRAAKRRYDLEGRIDPNILGHLSKLNLSRVVYLLLATAVLGWLMPNQVDDFSESRSVHERAIVRVDAISVIDECLNWKKGHAGRFPGGVDELPPATRPLIKSVEEKKQAEFVYIGSGVGAGNGRVVIFYSSSDFGNRGRVIAWSDGRIEFVEQVNPPTPVHPHH